ncbi:MAG: hypothetical protein WD490_07570 [Opitutales bacterium]
MKKLTKNRLLKNGSWLAIFAMFSVGFSSDDRNADVARPNIVIIYADDVGYGDIGVYGSELISTSHIDPTCTPATAQGGRTQG